MILAKFYVLTIRKNLDLIVVVLTFMKFDQCFYSPDLSTCRLAVLMLISAPSGGERSESKQQLAFVRIVVSPSLLTPCGVLRHFSGSRLLVPYVMSLNTYLAPPYHYTDTCKNGSCTVLRQHEEPGVSDMPSFFVYKNQRPIRSVDFQMHKNACESSIA